MIFAGPSSFSSVTEAASVKQWAQPCRSGLLRRKGMAVGDMGTPGMSTSIAADTNSWSQQGTLRVCSPSSDKGLHAQHAKECFRVQVFLISSNPEK